jgi:hypothetical protein
MHNCEEFREQLTEYIIDGKDVTADPRFQHDLLVCGECCAFYCESREMIAALASVDAGVPEEYWGSLNQRLGDTIRESMRESLPRPAVPRRRYWWPQLAAVAALLLITAGAYRMPAPSPAAPSVVTYVEQPVPLDPVTVDFLEQSELLLRNVMKISPNDSEDLADAKKVASEQLLAIDQRKGAAAHVPPVVNVMDTYETVLRDLRNVDERSAADDITDIQSRIQRNALIANMKAFQPRVSLVSYGR